MLPRLMRLTKAQDFSRVYRQGKTLTTSHLRLFYLKHKGATVSRFGFVISKKHEAKIVNRNRVKRVLRGAMKSFEVSLQPAYDAIVLGKAGIAAAPSEALRAELVELLIKAKLLLKP